MCVNGFSIESTDSPEEGFYEECASGRDFILVKYFPMEINVSGETCKVTVLSFLIKYLQNVHQFLLLVYKAANDIIYNNKHSQYILFLWFQSFC